MNHELDTMGRTIYGEASNQGFQGMLAVAYVILNRSQERKQTPAEVCQAPLQFSCWNVGDANRSRILGVSVEKSPLFCQCIVAAITAMDKSIPDPTDGANHYYADYINAPKWAKNMEFKTKIGVHIFLKG